MYQYVLWQYNLACSWGHLTRACGVCLVSVGVIRCTYSVKCQVRSYSIMRLRREAMFNKMKVMVFLTIVVHKCSVWIVALHLPPSLVMLAVGSKMQAATNARSAYKLATSPTSAQARGSTCRDPPGHRCWRNRSSSRWRREGVRGVRGWMCAGAVMQISAPSEKVPSDHFRQEVLVIIGPSWLSYEVVKCRKTLYMWQRLEWERHVKFSGFTPSKHSILAQVYVPTYLSPVWSIKSSINKADQTPARQGEVCVMLSLFRLP